MADKKISQLTGATTPVAGTEVLPIVQGGSTVKVSIDNLTAGKTVTASNFNGTALTASTLLATDASKNLASVTSAATTPLAGTEETAIIQSSAAKKVTVANLTAGRAVGGLSFTATKAGNDAFMKIENTGVGAAGAWQYMDSVDSQWMGTILQSGGVEKWFIGSYATSAFHVKNGGRSGTEALRIETSNDVKVSAGNLVVGTAAKGIDFSANTGAAGETSALLNWYEEGTWTPTVVANSGTITTVGTCTGQYTRIGRQVTLSMDLRITTNGTGAGFLQVTGIPFNMGTTLYGSGVGSEIGVTGKMLQASPGTATQINITNYDNTYPGANGFRGILVWTYFV